MVNHLRKQTRYELEYHILELNGGCLLLFFLLFVALLPLFFFNHLRFGLLVACSLYLLDDSFNLFPAHVYLFEVDVGSILKWVQFTHSSLDLISELM